MNTNKEYILFKHYCDIEGMQSYAILSPCGGFVSARDVYSLYGIKEAKKLMSIGTLSSALKHEIENNAKILLSGCINDLTNPKYLKEHLPEEFV